MFEQLKEALRGQRFNHRRRGRGVRRVVAHMAVRVPKEFFDTDIKKLPKRRTKCVTSERKYLGKLNIFVNFPIVNKNIRAFVLIIYEPLSYYEYSIYRL